MPPAFVQGASNFNSVGATSIAQAFPSNVGAGRLLVAAWGYVASAGVAFTLTDTQGNTWNVANVQSQNAGLGYVMGTAWAIAGASGANTVTLTLTTPQASFRFLIHEYSGADTLDQLAVASGTATAMSSGTATTTNASELLFGWIVSNSGWSTPGSGYTIRETSSLENTEDQIVSSTGSYAATGTQASTGAWQAMLATFYSLTGASPAALSPSAASKSAATATITTPGGAGVTLTPAPAQLRFRTSPPALLIATSGFMPMSSQLRFRTTKPPTVTATGGGGPPALTATAASVSATQALVNTGTSLGPFAATVSATRAAITAATRIGPSAASVSAAQVTITTPGGLVHFTITSPRTLTVIVMGYPTTLRILIG